MLRLSRDNGWRPGRDVPFFALVVTAALGTIPTISQRSFDLALAGTEVSFVPSDLAFLVLAVLVAGRLLGRARLPDPARAVTFAGGAFAAWLLASSLLNGAEAVVGAVRLLEYGVIALGVVLFVQRRSQLHTLVTVLVGLTVGADVLAVADLLEHGAGRKGAYLGMHEYAALSTMSLAVGLAAVYARAPRRLAIGAGAAGAIGVVLGAALAGLLGVYLAAAAIVGLAAARRSVTKRRLGATALVLLVVTAGVLTLRLADFGVGATDDDAGVAGGSWRVRAIHTYIAGKVFLENPIIGTGWYGELPPEEYAGVLPDVRRAFPDEPAHYFPTPPGDYIPQQTYDMVLAELGLVGAALFLLLGVLTTRTIVRVGREWPRAGDDEWLAFVPAAWLGSLAGALAGAALFGGGPLATFFWLTLGIAAVAPSLVPPRSFHGPARPAREPAAVG